MSTRVLLSRAATAAAHTTSPTSTILVRHQSLTSATRTLRTLSRPSPLRRSIQQTRLLASHTPSLVRWASSKSIADEKIEEITELYATARDEFEIAAEETQNNTVYAEEDRAAAREELTKLQAAYTDVIEGPDKEVAEEVKRRVGQRIRELETAVGNMEEMALHQD